MICQRQNQSQFCFLLSSIGLQRFQMNLWKKGKVHLLIPHDVELNAAAPDWSARFWQEAYSHRKVESGQIHKGITFLRANQYLILFKRDCAQFILPLSGHWCNTEDKQPFSQIIVRFELLTVHWISSLSKGHYPQNFWCSLLEIAIMKAFRREANCFCLRTMLLFASSCNIHALCSVVFSPANRSPNLSFFFFNYKFTFSVVPKKVKREAWVKKYIYISY